MVTTPHPSNEVAPGTLPSDRGFIREEEYVVSSSAPTYGGSLRTSFWGGSIVAGALLTLSLFAWSYALMLGCHVGVTAGGAIALGWGAAIWMFITGCVAYYFGGMLSNCLSRPVYGGYAKGAAVWALSIPLTLVIFAVIAGGTGLLTGLNLPQNPSLGNTTIVHTGVNFGFLWTIILTLAAGLFFSLMGSWSMVRSDARIPS